MLFSHKPNLVLSNKGSMMWQTEMRTDYIISYPNQNVVFFNKKSKIKSCLCVHGRKHYKKLHKHLSTDIFLSTTAKSYIRLYRTPSKSVQEFISHFAQSIYRTRQKKGDKYNGWWNRVDWGWQKGKFSEFDAQACIWVKGIYEPNEFLIMIHTQL